MIIVIFWIMSTVASILYLFNRLIPIWYGYILVFKFQFIHTYSQELRQFTTMVKKKKKKKKKNKGKVATYLFLYVL